MELKMTNKTYQCARCKREYQAKGMTYYNGKMFCNKCVSTFGSCASCQNQFHCAFRESPIPIPHTVQAERQEGVMHIIEERPNPKRIKALCIEGECKCVEKLGEKYACGRQFFTCKNYTEIEW